jgi:glutamate/tyrosine decarboxylase-like PLP-dependent enzyme
MSTIGCRSTESREHNCSTSCSRWPRKRTARATRVAVSGSIYSGDHDHYAFQVEAFGAFAHANVLQRDMYPSATKMESEIIAMTSDMLHGDEYTGGLVTSGGTESLVTAMLTYREWGRNVKGIDRRRSSCR